MQIGFDNIAAEYDDSFVNTVTGRLQREIIRKYLKNLLKENHSDILELACGTGEDAIWLAKKGHDVLSTDISSGMLKIAENKTTGLEYEGSLSFDYLDISDITTYPVNRKFDIIFSNFGGLNCISPEDLKIALQRLAELLRPGGKFISVIMPEFCIWEWFYFSLTGKHQQASRRYGSMPLEVKIGDGFVNTWYYSPARIVGLAEQYFCKFRYRPVGILLPPSYLDSFFNKHVLLTKTLNLFEKLTSKTGFFASYSDHYLIEMEVKQ